MRNGRHALLRGNGASTHVVSGPDTRNSPLKDDGRYQSPPTGLQVADTMLGSLDNARKRKRSTHKLNQTSNSVPRLTSRPVHLTGGSINCTVETQSTSLREPLLIRQGVRYLAEREKCWAILTLPAHYACRPIVKQGYWGKAPSPPTRFPARE